MTGPVFVAADLGAASGRVCAGSVVDGRLRMRETHRFPNVPVTVRGTLHWDILSLYRGILDGAARAARDGGTLAGLAVDSWAVDFGLLDADGVLLGNPVHYRDTRTAAAVARVHEAAPVEWLYERTGIQHQPFNTLFQIAAVAGTAQGTAARTLLLLPDLIGYWLTGRIGAERTNASTTQLLNLSTGDWDNDIIARAGLPGHLLPPLREPGTVIGPATVDGLGGVPVFAVGSHDTASAVAAVPADGPDFAYISCGTWSLVGVELDRPVVSDGARTANLTNEAGVDGTYRFLRNVPGLWLLEECLRLWRRDGQAADLPDLLRAAAELPAGRWLVDVDEPAFTAPPDMPAALRAACAAAGGPVPQGPPELVRCIVDSLAAAYGRVVRQVAELSGVGVEVVHLVGGGSRNALLCQATADACGVPVLSGPAEATAMGNLLFQARAAGALTADVREVVRRSVEVTRYLPRR